jgi:hypothetical protein
MYTLAFQLHCHLLLLSACTKPRKGAVMHMCVRVIDFASFCDISIGFWNFSVTSFSCGGSRRTRREPPTLGMQLVNFITCGCESSVPIFEIYKAGREPTLWASADITFSSGILLRHTGCSSCTLKSVPIHHKII